MAGYVFWAQLAHILFLGPRPQGQDIFWDFMGYLLPAPDLWTLEGFGLQKYSLHSIKKISFQ